MQEVGSECLDDPGMHQIEHGCDNICDFATGKNIHSKYHNFRV